MARQGSLFTIKDGKLVKKDPPCQESPPKILNYRTSLAPAPDRYLSQEIRRYRQENIDLRRRCTQLQRAYYQLLGWCGQNDCSQTFIPLNDFAETLKIDYSFTQDKSKSENLSENSYRLRGHYSNEYWKVCQNGPTISPQPTAQEYQDLGQNSNLNPQAAALTQRNVKTQADENLQEMLIQAFKEVRLLKQMLERLKINNQTETEALKVKYEHKFKYIEGLLQGERKNSKALTAQLNKIRFQTTNKKPSDGNNLSLASARNRIYDYDKYLPSQQTNSIKDADKMAFVFV